MANFWKTSRREIDYGTQPLVMAILNVTPDSFSDGGQFLYVDAAIEQAERMIGEGARAIRASQQQRSRQLHVGWLACGRYASGRD